MQLHIIGFLLGIATHCFFVVKLSYYALLLVIITIFGLFMKSRHKSLSIILAYCLGFAWMHYNIVEFNITKNINLPAKINLRVIGKVDSLPTKTNYGCKFDLVANDISQYPGKYKYSNTSHRKKYFRSADNLKSTIKNIYSDNQRKWNEAKLKLSLHAPHNLCSKILSNDIWQFITKLKKPRNYYNPGSFDIERYNYRQRIVATGFVKASKLNKLIKKSNRTDFRSFIKKKLTSQLVIITLRDLF